MRGKAPRCASAVVYDGITPAHAGKRSPELLKNAGYDTSSVDALKDSFEQRTQDITDAKEAAEVENRKRISRQSVASVYRSTDIQDQAPTLPTGMSGVDLAEAQRQNFKAQSTIKNGRVELQLSMLKTNANVSTTAQLNQAKSAMTKEAQRKLTSIERLSEALNMDVVVHDVMTGTNGFFGEDGKIHFTLSSKLSVPRVAAHELTHKMKSDARTQYDAVRDQIIQNAGQEEFDDLMAEKAREYGFDLKNESQRELCDDEVVAELCEGMLSDSKKLSSFAERHLEAAKALKTRLTKIIVAIKNALNGTEQFSDEMFIDRDVTDKWLEGLDSVIAKAEARQKTLEGSIATEASVTTEQQESLIQDVTEIHDETQQKTEEKASVLQDEIAELELALEAVQKDIEHWKKLHDEDMENGYAGLAENDNNIIAEGNEIEKAIETMLAKVGKGEALSSAELATLDKLYDNVAAFSYAKDWKAFREQAQNQQSGIKYRIEDISLTQKQKEAFDEYVQNALAGVGNNSKSRLVYGKVDPVIVQWLQAHGINVGKSPSHVVTDNDIRHFRNSHANTNSPKYGLNQWDIMAIPYIVENGRAYYYPYNGKKGILYVVDDNDATYYVEDIFDGVNFVGKQMMKTSKDKTPKMYAEAMKKEALITPLDNASKDVPGMYVQDVRQQNASTDKIAQAEQTVNTPYALDSVGRELSKGQQEYFKASVIRDEQGRLKVMYRGGRENFTVFDRKKASYSNLYGRGFYFTDSESHARQYGDARAYYLKVTNPVSTEQTTITRAQLRKFIKVVAQNEDYGLDNYGYGATVDSVLKKVYGSRSDFAMLYDIDTVCVGDMVATVELFNEVNGTNYDGFILPTETVVFSSEQI